MSQRPPGSVHTCPILRLTLTMTMTEQAQRQFTLEVGRCRYFSSVSVFGFLVGFYRSRFGIRYRFLKISDIGSVFRLSNPFL